LRPIEVADARVEIGVGSPIPVEVQTAGAWPDLCARLATIEQRVQGNRIEIALLASAADSSCPPDHLGLSFGMALPLNMQEMPAGTYIVAVNGFETRFDWTGANSGAAAAPATGQPVVVTAADVQVEVGVGSPIPVNVQVSGTWPGLCSQLTRIDQHIYGRTIDISILASPDPAGCPPDAVGLPFRIAIPLNMVEMDLGSYTVRVNGVQAAFDWQAQPGVMDAAPGDFTLVYSGPDGNLWVRDAQSGEPRQITQDAARPTFGQAGVTQPAQVVDYYFAALSSDGRMLAYRRDVGTPAASGLSYTFGLWATDLTTGESRQLLDRIPVGFAWKPGTHILAYAPSAGEGYFATRGQVNASLAQGVWSIDVDQAGAEPTELIQPERGYTLGAPVWSPDGRFLAFDEVNMYEGKGMFAYYDFEAAKYMTWDEAIGQYAWSPDGARIAYDRMTYTATGEERIYLRPRLEGQEQQFSPATLQGHAFNPRIAPQGDRIAYLVAKDGPDTQRYSLMVQPMDGGEAQELGIFEGGWGLDWTPDGSGLVLCTGPFEAAQIILVNVSDGVKTVLAYGRDPVLPAP
jgi:hypothetical protein